MRTFAAALLGLILLAPQAQAQTPQPGNTLITPLRSTETFIIDIDLNTLRTWHGDNGAGHTVYLLPDLSVIRSQGDPNGHFGGGGAGGQLQRVDVNDNIVWDYLFSNEDHQQHHDIEPLPNGNLLIIAWEIVTPAEAIAAGRTAPSNGDLWPTLLVELEPVGSNDANIVWEWRIWDRIIQDTDPAKPNYAVIADHPERIDVNLGNVQRSWDHGNYVDYDPLYDLVVLSCRRLDEVLVIDHSTTTEEAAGHSGGRFGKGGDILYRWGNPQNYGRGDADDHFFWGVHGANFIDPGVPGAGGILAFNNGAREGDADDRSGVVELQPPRDAHGNFVIEPGQAFGPTVPDWEYEAGNAFYSLRYGSAYRQPNGNTLICEGVDGFIFEVTPAKDRVWAYVEPAGNGVFAAQRYWPGRFIINGTIDVSPGMCPNVLEVPDALAARVRHDDDDDDSRMNKGGVCRVAIAGELGFDVGLIDPASITLEGVPALRVRIKDRVDPECDHGGGHSNSPARGNDDDDDQGDDDDDDGDDDDDQGDDDDDDGDDDNGGPGGQGCDCMYEGIDYSDSCTCTCRRSDGHEDLLVDFATEDLIAAIGVVNPGELVDVTLNATMADGKRFEASDCILFVASHHDDDDDDDGDDDDGDDDDDGANDAPPITNLRTAPNPFNPSTSIRFRIDRDRHVRLAIYDVRGRLVAQLIDGPIQSGSHVIEWKAADAPSGVYFYRIQAGDFLRSGRLILLK